MARNFDQIITNPETDHIVGDLHHAFIEFPTIKDTIDKGKLVKGQKYAIGLGIRIVSIVEGNSYGAGMNETLIGPDFKAPSSGIFEDYTYDVNSDIAGILIKSEEITYIIPNNSDCGIREYSSIYPHDPYHIMYFPYTPEFLKEARDVLVSNSKDVKSLYKASLKKIVKLRSEIEGLQNKTSKTIHDVLIHGLSQIGVVNNVRQVLGYRYIREYLDRVKERQTETMPRAGFVISGLIDVFEKKFSNRANIIAVSPSTKVGQIIVASAGDHSIFPVIFRVGVERNGKYCLERLKFETKAVDDFDVAMIGLASEPSDVHYVNNGVITGLEYSQEEFDALLRDLYRRSTLTVKASALSLVDAFSLSLEKMSN